MSGERRAEAVERFSDEASVVAEKPVSIRCDEARDYVGAVQHTDGVATLGGDLAILTPEICHDLYRLAFDGEVTGSRTGRAIAVLAHESWHLRGVGDEATTECYALQSGVALGAATRPRRGQGPISSCASSSPRTRCAERRASSTASRRTVATAAASISIPGSSGFP